MSKLAVTGSGSVGLEWPKPELPAALPVRFFQAGSVIKHTILQNMLLCLFHSNMN